MNAKYPEPIRWAKTHPLGELSLPAYPGDGGFDLTAVENMSIGPLNHGQGVVKVACGIRVALPRNVNALLLGRSNAILGGLLVVPTLIDAGYRGHLFAMVLNLNPIMTVHIKQGDRLAQLTLLPLLADLYDVEQVEQDALPPSERGSKGMGSTGGVHSSISPVALSQVAYDLSKKE